MTHEPQTDSPAENLSASENAKIDVLTSETTDDGSEKEEVSSSFHLSDTSIKLDCCVKIHVIFVTLNLPGVSNVEC